jgi:hypothetical protein
MEDRCDIQFGKFTKEVKLLLLKYLYFAGNKIVKKTPAEVIKQGLVKVKYVF